MLYQLMLSFLFLVYDAIFAYTTIAYTDKAFSQSQNVHIEKPVKRTITGKVNEVNAACLLKGKYSNINTSYYLYYFLIMCCNPFPIFLFIIYYKMPNRVTMLLSRSTVVLLN